MNKDDIRLRIRTRKSLLDDKERRSAAEAVFDLLEHTAAFMISDRILLYHSLPDELSTIAFIDKWHDRKKFYLPRVNGLNLEITSKSLTATTPQTWPASTWSSCRQWPTIAAATA